MFRFGPACVLFILLMSLSSIRLKAQTIIIDTILIEGNKRTKDKIILRELFFSTGDTLINDSRQILSQSRAALMRRNLFTEVEVSLLDSSDDPNQTVLIRLKELWPIYPIPKFDILDRSYTVWIKEEGASFDRILYGLSLKHINLTGHGDQLDLDAIWGFKRTLKLDYSSPPLNKLQNIRASAQIEYSEERDIDVGVDENNELLRIRSESKSLKSEFRYGISLLYRFNNDLYFEGNFNMRHINLSDSVKLINPKYYSPVENWHDTWHFNTVYDTRGRSLFPVEGMKFTFGLERAGLVQKQVNSVAISAEWLQTFPIRSNRFGFLNVARWGLRDWDATNDYYFQRRISGELSNLRAYETSFLLGKSFLSNRIKVYQLLTDRSFKCLPAIATQYVQEIPYMVYVTFNMDFAYVSGSEDFRTDLNDSWLYSFGPSVEIVLYNNFIFTVDYSLDRDWKSSFNINFDTSF